MFNKKKGEKKKKRKIEQIKTSLAKIMCLNKNHICTYCNIFSKEIRNLVIKEQNGKYDHI